MEVCRWSKNNVYHSTLSVKQLEISGISQNMTFPSKSTYTLVHSIKINSETNAPHTLNSSFPVLLSQPRAESLDCDHNLVDNALVPAEKSKQLSTDPNVQPKTVRLFQSTSQLTSHTIYRFSSCRGNSQLKIDQKRHQTSLTLVSHRVKSR